MKPVNNNCGPATWPTFKCRIPYKYFTETSTMSYFSLSISNFLSSLSSFSSLKIQEKGQHDGFMDSWPCHTGIGFRIPFEGIGQKRYRSHLPFVHAHLNAPDGCNQDNCYRALDGFQRTSEAAFCSEYLHTMYVGLLAGV